MITKDSVISFFKKVWKFVKKICRKLIEIGEILIDLGKFIIAPTVEKGVGLFKRIVRLFTVAVNDNGDIVECVTDQNGEVYDYENHSQIIQGQMTEETKNKFENADDVIIGSN